MFPLPTGRPNPNPNPNHNHYHNRNHNPNPNPNHNPNQNPDQNLVQNLTTYHPGVLTLIVSDVDQAMTALWYRILADAGFLETERTTVPALIEVSDALLLPQLEPEAVWLAEPKYRAKRRERYERDKKDQEEMAEEARLIKLFTR